MGTETVTTISAHAAHSDVPFFFLTYYFVFNIKQRRKIGHFVALIRVFRFSGFKKEIAKHFFCSLQIDI